MNTVLSIFRDPVRRKVIEVCIRGGYSTLTFDELVDEIRRDDPPSSKGIPSEKKSLEIELYHNQLPRLNEFGLIEYDARSGTIRYHSSDRVEKLHEFIDDELTVDRN